MIVEEKEDGNLRLKFTPEVPGAYNIKVTVDDEERIIVTECGNHRI